MQDAPFSPDHFRLLAEFRFQIRQFLQFSEAAARRLGIEPQQHQLLLAIKGLPAGTRPTVRAIATRLCLRHNSTVELINRLASHGALMRRPSAEDRREVLVELTPFGEDLLERLSVLHMQELKNAGPTLATALGRILESDTAAPKTPLQAAEAQA